MYVRVAKAEDRTLGGVLLPGSSQQRPTSGQVVSVGDGRLPDGNTMDFTVKPGDEVREPFISRSFGQPHAETASHF